MYDPKSEQCYLCGREADECVCALAADIPDSFDPLGDNDDDSYLFGPDEPYEEEDENDDS